MRLKFLIARKCKIHEKTAVIDRHQMKQKNYTLSYENEFSGCFTTQRWEIHSFLLSFEVFCLLISFTANLLRKFRNLSIYLYTSFYNHLLNATEQHNWNDTKFSNSHQKNIKHHPAITFTLVRIANYTKVFVIISQLLHIIQAEFDIVKDNT